ncbi:hypothetical protein DM860_004150 [Cuscuta australis]|uniref:Uncharacterized protein n=1 Tax=Cuscuta australis TaxID=267555 RepID=A0A328CXR8_9ASTE|nr:hypothetical protein DM860_004150 [Cuscuta australis]
MCLSSETGNNGGARGVLCFLLLKLLYHAIQCLHINSLHRLRRFTAADRIPRSPSPNSRSIGDGVILPAQKHHDAAPEDIEPSLLLLGHGQAPLPEAGFPAGSPARREKGRVDEVHRRMVSDERLWGGDMVSGLGGKGVDGWRGWIGDGKRVKRSEGLRVDKCGSVFGVEVRVVGCGGRSMVGVVGSDG